ncbi:hypothetical protein Nepgr_011879 [Nepenthes gracilis]|uniref:Eukaryotic translation initiation factor 2 subunit beta n=1 Tax=Nepenthes gracilis TaxID=150966 RepID=A0AAD3SEV3_NEPGR|nr:hypothetical protein Nepgr_011879 [Nepenthes gracilis]
MAEESLREAKEDVQEIAPFDPTKKKKKKKGVDWHSANNSVRVMRANFSGTEVENGFLSLQKEEKNCGGLDILKEMDADTAVDLDDHIDDDDTEEGGIAPKLACSWEGSDRDYEYGELLHRFFSILHVNNPELAGERQLTVLRLPQVLREGTRTIFANFMDLCKTMHRQPKDVMAFMLSKLRTNGSLDGQLRLVFKQRFAPTDLEEILGRYIDEYVVCNVCRSPDTTLSKENLHFVLSCEQCGSERFVAPIMCGYDAQMEWRKSRK